MGMGLKRSKYFVCAKTWVFAQGGSYIIINIKNMYLR